MSQSSGPPPWLPDGYWPDGPRLGTGPTADVWPAIDRSTGARVAVKVWHKPLTGRLYRDLYGREFDAHRLLAGTSGHVVAWAGGSSSDFRPWIATALHGTSLSDLLEQSGRPSPAQAAVLAMDLVRGLAAIHGCGLVHRDVTPRNVLVRDGRAVLCDLGLAMLAGETVLDPRAGTPRYRAPEVLASGLPSQASDVYSTTQVLRELLGDPAPHPLLERLLRRGESSLPADRPGSGMEYASRFADACSAAGFSVPAARPPDPIPPSLSSPTPSRRWRRPHLSRAALVALASYVAIAAALGTMVILMMVAAALFTLADALQAD